MFVVHFHTKLYNPYVEGKGLFRSFSFKGEIKRSFSFKGEIKRSFSFKGRIYYKSFIFKGETSEPFFCTSVHSFARFSVILRERSVNCGSFSFKGGTVDPYFKDKEYCSAVF